MNQPLSIRMRLDRGPRLPCEATRQHLGFKTNPEGWLSLARISMRFYRVGELAGHFLAGENLPGIGTAKMEQTSEEGRLVHPCQ
jgi:hypothetical protein